MKVLSGIEKSGAYVVTFSETTIMDEAKIIQIGAEFKNMLSRANNQRLLVSFSGVTFMSSSMVSQLVLLKRQSEAAGIALKFCSITPDVMELFDITNLSKLFSIYKDEEKALKAFDKKGWFS